MDAVELHDVYIVNISMCQDIQVKKEAQMVPEAPPSLNLRRVSTPPGRFLSILTLCPFLQLNTRVRNQVEQKRRLVSALTAGVSREGQKLYLAIAKTINEVTWSGPNIVVFNDVIIAPPYTVDSVTGAPGSRQLTYVKKIVEKNTSNPSAAAEALLSGGGSSRDTGENS